MGGTESKIGFRRAILNLTAKTNVSLSVASFNLFYCLFQNLSVIATPPPWGMAKQRRYWENGGIGSHR